MDSLETFLASVGTSVCGSGLLIYALKRSLDHKLAKNLARINAELDRKRVGLESTDAKKHVAVDEVHKAAINARIAVGSLLSLLTVGTTEQERIDQASRRVADLVQVFQKNMLYLPENIYDGADQLFQLLLRCSTAFTVWTGIPDYEQADRQKHEAKVRALAEFEETVPPVIDKLTADCRRELGVIDDD